MKVLVLGYYSEIEYIHDMCYQLGQANKVTFMPLFKLIQERPISNVFEHLFFEISHVDIVCWQCLHALDLQDVAYLIEKTVAVHVLFCYDDNKSVGHINPFDLARLRLLHAVFTSSATNVALLGNNGVYHPPVVSIPRAVAPERLPQPRNKPMFFIANRRPTHLLAADPVPYEHLPRYGVDYGNIKSMHNAIFVNIYQADIGGASPDMMRCMALGIAVVSPVPRFVCAVHGGDGLRATLPLPGGRESSAEAKIKADPRQGAIPGVYAPGELSRAPADRNAAPRDLERAAAGKL